MDTHHQKGQNTTKKTKHHKKDKTPLKWTDQSQMDYHHQFGQTYYQIGGPNHQYILSQDQTQPIILIGAQAGWTQASPPLDLGLAKLQTQTAKYIRGADEAHQSLAKIHTKPYHVCQKSAPMFSIGIKNLHQPLLQKLPIHTRHQLINK